MRIISINSLKGGVGKTSVTLGLASAALNAKIPTLIIDLDPNSDISNSLNIENSNIINIANILNNYKKINLEQNVVHSKWPFLFLSKNQTKNTNYVNHLRRKPKNRLCYKLDIIIGSVDLKTYDRPFLKKKKLNKLSYLLNRTEKYRLVLIDCPASSSGLSQIAWFASTEIVIVTEPSLFSINSTNAILYYIDNFKQKFPFLKTKLKGIIVNKFRKNSPEHIYRLTEIYSLFHQYILQPIIHEDVLLQQIQGSSLPIHQWPFKESLYISKTYSKLLYKFFN